MKTRLRPESPDFSTDTFDWEKRLAEDPSARHPKPCSWTVRLYLPRREQAHAHYPDPCIGLIFRRGNYYHACAFQDHEVPRMRQFRHRGAAHAWIAKHAHLPARADGPAPRSWTSSVELDGVRCMITAHYSSAVAISE